MKLITRDTDYAVRALIFISKQKEKIVSVRRLVNELEIPRPFLRKILQRLNKKGILKSYRGLGGGFRLAIAPKQIFLLDLIGAFQGPLQLNECIFKKKICPNRNVCPLRRKINLIEREVASRLKPVTIENLLKQRG
jgi:Rrf2 family protein